MRSGAIDLIHLQGTIFGIVEVKVAETPARLAPSRRMGSSA